MKTLFAKLAALATRFFETYLKTSTGTLTLAASDAADRNVIIIIDVIEDFANGSGAQPTFSVGETTLATKFSATALLTNAKAGQRFILAGLNVAARAIIVTATAGTGTSTGAIRVNAATFPTTR
jgi:hypothetical protein